MRTLALFAFLLLIVFTVKAQETANKNTNQALVWTSLFNGHNTDGWRGFNKDSSPANWHVENGCLCTSSSGGSESSGDLITVEMFEDFELYLEWSISPGGNSGIFFNVTEGESGAAYETGPEYQIIDDTGFPGKLEVWQQTGANYALHPADPGKKTLRPVGEFNSSAIRVESGHVTHWLNDSIIVEYELWTDDWYRMVKNSKWKDYPGYGLSRKGHIGLQDHGSPVCYRNIRIREIRKGPANISR